MSRATLCVSPDARLRIRAASDAIAALPRSEPATLVVPSLSASERLMLGALPVGAAAFAWQRTGFDELARALALPRLAERGLAALSGEAAVLLAQRAVERVASEGRLGRLSAIARTPGFGQALKATLDELRLAGVDAASLARESDVLGALLGAYEDELAQRRLCDRAGVLATAAEAVRAGEGPRALARVVWFDVPLVHAREAELFAALVAGAGSAFVSVVHGDGRTEGFVLAALPHAERARDAGEPSTQLDLLKQRLFASEGSVPQGLVPNVQFVASPGEAREAVEAVRGLLQRAASGVPFDRMAIVLRAAEAYRSVVEEALARAGVPAYFAAGVARPRPEGRALLALLACARDGLSLDGLAGYLSLGVQPALNGITSARRVERVLRAACAGTSPHGWAARVSEYAQGRRREAELPELSADQLRRLHDDAALADALAEFLPALLGPLERLRAGLPFDAALAALEELGRAALAEPASLEPVWAELLPLASPAPTHAAALHQLLARRLGRVLLPPTGRAAGRVYVGTPDDLRGLSFDACFVLGLTEQLFPQRPREDALLSDAVRRRLSPALMVTEERVHGERVLLRLAVGAAEAWLALSFPRFDPLRGRPRVPSFYGLEVLHAIDGVLPAFDALARRAHPGAAARMGFPAPDAPAHAIDDAEYDLSVLGQLVSGPSEARPGAARYLLESHPHLARALRFRARRWSVARFTPADGFVAADERLRAYVAERGLSVHPYAATTLEALAACPYRFYLKAWLSLPEADDEHTPAGLTPRLRGSLFHAVQTRVIRRLCADGPTSTAYARAPALAPELASLAAAALAELVPEEARRDEPLVRSELAELVRDLGAWLSSLGEERSYAPLAAELGFGLSASPARDPRSVSEPVQLPQLRLRGAIDLVEEGPPGTDGRRLLRVTDTKTGKFDHAARDVVSGGRSLQAVLYALAAEQLFPEHVVNGARLAYSTARGEFNVHEVALVDTTRAIASDYLTTVQRLFAGHALLAVPQQDACKTCGYRSVCGPYEEERVARVKRGDPRLEPLHHLRSLP